MTVFLRQHKGSFPGEPSTRLTENEVIVLLGASVKDVQRAIKRLKRGERIETRYGSYVVEEV